MQERVDAVIVLSWLENGKRCNVYKNSRTKEREWDCIWGVW